MTELKPFDPSNEFDAMSEWFRERTVDTVLEAGEAAIFRDMPNGEKMQCILGGVTTGLVGVLFAFVEPKHRGEVIRAIKQVLPFARQQAESIMGEPQEPER